MTREGVLETRLALAAESTPNEAELILSLRAAGNEWGVFAAAREEPDDESDTSAKKIDQAMDLLMLAAGDVMGSIKLDEYRRIAAQKKTTFCLVEYIWSYRSDFLDVGGLVNSRLILDEPARRETVSPPLIGVPLDSALVSPLAKDRCRDGTFMPLQVFGKIERLDDVWETLIATPSSSFRHDLGHRLKSSAGPIFRALDHSTAPYCIYSLRPHGCFPRNLNRWPLVSLERGDLVAVALC